MVSWRYSGKWLLAKTMNFQTVSHLSIVIFLHGPESVIRSLPVECRLTWPNMASHREHTRLTCIPVTWLGDTIAVGMHPIGLPMISPQSCDPPGLCDSPWLVECHQLYKPRGELLQGSSIFHVIEVTTLAIMWVAAGPPTGSSPYMGIPKCRVSMPPAFQLSPAEDQPNPLPRRRSGAPYSTNHCTTT